MSKKIFRVHTHESVYVGPTEPHATFPPNETLQFPEREAEWTFEENAVGDVTVTHRNPRAKVMKVDGKDVPTPSGQVHSTRIPAANIRDVQYESSPMPSPRVKIVDAPSKGAA